MLSTHSLISKIQTDYPNIRFANGTIFRWSPQERTVYYANTTDTASLIHEVAHALLDHKDYTKDVDLLKMERDAWQYAVHSLAKQYDLTVNEDVIQDAIDSYRTWLHSRSICPDCHATGLQSDTNLYTCIACHTVWRVNEARSCALRRYNVSQK